MGDRRRSCNVSDAVCDVSASAMPSCSRAGWLHVSCRGREIRLKQIKSPQGLELKPSQRLHVCVLTQTPRTMNFEPALRRKWAC